MGLTVSVYRNAEFGDCTLDGISSKHQSLTIVNINGPFEPNDNAPAVFLESHYKGCLRIVPAVCPGPDHKWIATRRSPMFGGNYAATSDSRFAKACEQMLGHYFYGAVPIHDRYETAEQARRLGI